MVKKIILKRLGKKAGLTFDLVVFMFRFIILSIVAISLVIFVNHFINVNIEVNNVEGEVFFQSLMHSPNGICYYDSNLDRLYSGIISADEFRDHVKLEEKLNQAFNFEKNKYISAEITLLDINNQNYEGISSRYYNKDYYDVWGPMGYSAIGGLGPGGAVVFEKIYPVIILDNNKKVNGFVRIVVAIPKS